MVESSHSAASLEGEQGFLHCMVVTPEATVLDEPADFVALPLFDGEIGIAPLHSPMIGRLGYGEMRLVRGKSTQAFYINGGFVQVSGDLVCVLTGRAVAASQIDGAIAEGHLEAARNRPAHTQELMDIRDRAVTQARAQLRISRKAK